MQKTENRFCWGCGKSHEMFRVDETGVWVCADTGCVFDDNSEQDKKAAAETEFNED